MNTQPATDWYSDVDHDEADLVQVRSDLEQVIPGVSPGALLEAMEDPTVFPEIARGDLYTQMARLRRDAGGKYMSVAQRLEYSKFLAKMGKVEAPEKDVIPFATAPSINIHFSSRGTVSFGASTPQEREINVGAIENDI